MRHKIFLMFMMGGLLASVSCGKSDDTTPDTPQTKQEEVTQALVGSGGSGKTWKIQSLTVDGVDETSTVKGMTIKFSSTTFTVTNGGPVWPSNGSWTFSSTEASSIKLDNGTEVKVEVTDTTLKLSLTWNKNTFGPGRVESISGQQVFVFTS